MIAVLERMEILRTVLKRYHAGLAITLSGGKCSKRLHVAEGLYRNAVNLKCQLVINCDIKLVCKHFSELVFYLPRSCTEPNVNNEGFTRSYNQSLAVVAV